MTHPGNNAGYLGEVFQCTTTKQETQNMVTGYKTDCHEGSSNVREFITVQCD
jgi:hypothetical protein